MGKTLKSFWSFTRRLTSDPTANTLAIAAASLIPLMAMVGGGVDASRYYMTQSRLQAACDAGALAARRSMNDDTFADEDRIVGENFFDQNFPEGTFGSEDLARAYTASSDGEVTGEATTTLPTTIMGAFGFDQVELAVECEADINISNTDIMFVIDVTGSMNCAPDNPGGGSCGNSPDPGSKIEGLQEAMMLFYDTVEDSTSDAAQVRYGVVPYSSNVNVGRVLMEGNPAWFAPSHTYQSRRWDVVVGPWETDSTTYSRYSGANTWDVQSSYNESFTVDDFDECQDYADDTRYIDSFVSTNESAWVETSQSGTNPRTTTYDGDVVFEALLLDSGTYNNGSKICDLNWEIVHYEADTTITVTESREESSEWVYEPVEFNLAGLYSNVIDGEDINIPANISLPLGTNGANTNVGWDGCVEEAETVAAESFNPAVPVGANDLNINLVPSNAQEFWKPVLRNAVWERRDGDGIADDDSTNTNQGDRTTDTVRESERVNEDGDIVNQSRPGYNCTTEAFRLTDIDRDDFDDFVDSLEARGNTYHDIGMIWGARLISPRGIFAADNEAAPNGDAISRHIVFMTDGLLVPNVETYGMYGVEWWDRRVTGNGNSGRANSRHAERFQAACRAARRENISVWVVAFGTTLTTNLTDCATPGRAFQAANTDALVDQFEQIAQQIAALRLTQ